MDVIDLRVKKYQKVDILIDKKMRERKAIYDKYTVPLDNNQPFENDEFVKVIRKSDFEKIGNMMKSLKTERQQLKKQIHELTKKGKFKKR